MRADRLQKWDAPIENGGLRLKHPLLHRRNAIAEMLSLAIALNDIKPLQRSFQLSQQM